MSSKREQLRLADIIENIELIEEFIDGRDVDTYLVDRRTSNACERCLERVCEAIVKIGADRMKEIAPDILVDRVRGLGNVMRHSYDMIDNRFLFTLMIHDLPPLRTACAAALAQ